jgi:surface carbohydrate biosynthesis protein
MKPTRAVLLIPVENQVRELDAKLLLAVVAARRGFRSIIGPRREMHFHITYFPRGIYLSKSMTAASRMMFQIMSLLGHRVVAWDEEALVHLPAETYYSRRLSAAAMSYVSMFFAWGEDNAALWKDFTGLPDPSRIRVTGNPRNDLLRPEVTPYYAAELEGIRRTYGEFVLINTNFNHVNAFSPAQNLFQPPARPGEQERPGRASVGMTAEFAKGFRAHKQAVFEDFQRLIPKIERAFPDLTFVVRPHPTENPDIYHRIAAGCRRVRVTNEGNVVPWLMAAKALIHNGCTTGVEAFAMGIPALSYRASVNDTYDDGFYMLPNRLSLPCFDFDELRRQLGYVLAGPAPSADNGVRRALLDQHLAALNGPLACERIVDAIVEMEDGPPASMPGIGRQWIAHTLAMGRTLVKRFKDSRPGSYNRPSFQRHRYPPLSPDGILDRIQRFQRILGYSNPLRVTGMRERFFVISSEPNHP